MPRIKAGSVAEHRAAVMTQLLDGTERLLLSGADATLTAAGIAAEAGIARNSIYRYVSSVDDLIEMVLVDPHLTEATIAAIVDACIGRIDAGQPLPEVLDHARKSVGAVIDACMPG